MVDCGVISRESGQWEGVTTSDDQFIGITIATGIANGGDALFPDTDAYPSIDMTGFSGLLIAIKPTNGGNFAIEAVMGPDTLPFGGLPPVNAAAGLRGLVFPFGTASDFENIFNDAAETMTADVWNIFSILTVLEGQKNMQFKITNNTGGASDVEFAFLRVV